MSSARGAGTVVIGLGNPLMGDDGLGLAALTVLREQWRFEPPVTLVDGGTWGLTLLPMLEDAGRVLFLDAIRSGATPGQVVVVPRDRLPRILTTKVSPHQIDLREVLALGELRGTLPADILAIGVEPAEVRMQTELSAPVAAALPALLERVIAVLGTWGHEAQPTAKRPCTR
jgi:hydrogenase maturation protease